MNGESYEESEEENIEEQDNHSIKGFIGLKQNMFYDESSHEIKVNIDVKTKEYQRTLKKTLQEVVTLFYELQYERFNIITEKMPDLIQIYEEEELNEDLYKRKGEFISKCLESFFDEISLRDDIISNHKIQDFFKIIELKYTSMQPPKYLLKICSELANDEITIQDFDYDYANGVYVIALSGKGAISNLGRIWSIMQKNVLGGLEIYKGATDHVNTLPNFMKLLEKTFEAKILSCALQITEAFIDIYLAQNTGKLYQLRIIRSPNSEAKATTKEFQILKEPVIKQINYDLDKLLVIGEISIRLFCLKELCTKGGGCLTSRLKQSTIVDVNYDPNSCLLMILSSNSVLYLYKLKDWSLQYITEKHIKGNKKYIKVDYQKAYIFQMSPDELGIFRLKMFDDEFEFLNVGNLDRNNPINIGSKINGMFSAFCYDSLNGFVYVGSTNGNIHVWDVNNGKLVSSITGHLMEIIKIMFVDEINSFVSVCEEEAKFWRIGDISDQLTGEIIKHNEKMFSPW